MSCDHFVSAVIVAAGNSTRMNQDKITLPLLGIPCICRTMMAFEKAENVNEIIVVTSRNLVSLIERYAKQYGISKYSTSVIGGDCRQKSAAIGFSAIDPRSDFVMIHDGARPLISCEEIDGVGKVAFEYGSAVCAVPVKDTVKMIGEDGFIRKTFDRSALVAAATPQCFSTEIYRQIVEKSKENYNLFTDDSSMAEAIGYKVKVYFGSYSNVKLTTWEDVCYIENLIKNMN